MLINQLVELSSIDLTSTWHNNIFSNIKLVMELLDLLGVDGVSVFSDTSAGLTEVVVAEGCVVDVLESGFEWVHWGSVFVKGGFKGLDLDGLVGGFKDDLGEEAYGFRELGFIEEKSKAGDLSVHLHLQDASESINPFLNLFFWVGLGASQSSMGHKLCHWTVLQSLLSASHLDIHSDGSLVSGPVFSSHSDTITKLRQSGGSGTLKSLRDFTPW